MAGGYDWRREYVRQFGPLPTSEDFAVETPALSEGDNVVAFPREANSPCQEPMPACRPGRDECVHCRRLTMVTPLGGARRIGQEMRQQVRCGCSLGRTWRRSTVLAASRRKPT